MLKLCWVVRHPNIAVLSYNRSKYSETFIQNQVKHLGGNVHYLYGGNLPTYYGEDKELIKTDILSEAFLAAQRKLFGKNRYEQHLSAVERYFLKNDIQLVLANYAITAFPVMDICRRNNIPLIVHFHGWTAYRKSVLEEYKEQYKLLFKRASAIVAVSDDMKSQLENLGAPKEKIHVIRCGADENLFQFSDHTGNEPVFFSPGRFCETKNPHLTIRAFAIAQEQIPDAKLIMAGGDEGYLQKCKDLIVELGLTGKVEIKEAQTHEQVRSLMQTSAALVQHSATTSQGEKEGTPVSVLEAALSGLPVVATRHAGIAEVFENGNSALLCEEFDVAGMAENMIRVVKDKQLSKEISGNAYTTVKSKYTLAHYINAIDALISNTITGK
jgi:glycosyltransferase involved in cell wall biosynthesis